MRSNLEVYGFAHPDADTWIVHFGWAKNPLPMNGSHGHPRAYSKQVKAIRTQGIRGIEHARIPALGRCTAQLTWWVSTDRVRDEDNLADLEKRLFDALVITGVVADDRPELMAKPRGRIRHVDDSNGLVTEACFTLTVTREDGGRELVAGRQVRDAAAGRDPLEAVAIHDGDANKAMPDRRDVLEPGPDDIPGPLVGDGEAGAVDGDLTGEAHPSTLSTPAVES